MSTHYYYLVMLFPILLADVLLYWRYWGLLKRRLLPIILTVLFFSFPWYFAVDILAVRVWHIWFYDTQKILGIWIAGTAVEEFLWVPLVIFFYVGLFIVLSSRAKRKTH